MYDIKPSVKAAGVLHDFPDRLKIFGHAFFVGPAMLRIRRTRTPIDIRRAFQNSYHNTDAIQRVTTRLCAPLVSPSVVAIMRHIM